MLVFIIFMILVVVILVENLVGVFVVGVNVGWGCGRVVNGIKFIVVVVNGI